MNIQIQSIIEELKKKDTKKIEKILAIIILVNLLMSLIAIFTNLFSLNRIIKTIINCLVGIVNIILVIFILRKEETAIETEKIEIDSQYTPIMLQFFRKSELDANINLLLAECLDLEKRGLLEINKNEDDCIFTLKSENFIRMNGIENIQEEQIDSYSTNNVPAYENLYITKILFPFENSVSFKDMIKKSKDGYYQSRIEMCEFLLEKMILHELEKENIIKGNKSKTFFIILIVNIIISVLSWIGLGMFNIILLLGTVLNITISAILLKNENIFAYNFKPEITYYINNLTKYVAQINLNAEEIKKEELILKILFGNITIDEKILTFIS